nr:MAG TPA: hypothetical protein [Caudoviricetes sp.]
MPRKSSDVYAVITDFSLQYQRSEKTGTELGRPVAVPYADAAPIASRGRGHTRWRGRPMAWEAVRRSLPPSQRSWAAAARERPQLRRMPRCILPATGPALRCAPRRGPLGGEFAAMAYTCARSTRLMRRRALPRKAHAAILLPNGPGGPSGVWRHTPSWQGRAVRGGSPRGAHRSRLAALALANRPGLGVPATPSSLKKPGEGSERAGR